MGQRIYSCSNCRCHAADHDGIVSKVRYFGGDEPRTPAVTRHSARPTPRAPCTPLIRPFRLLQSFQGRHGRAYLFNNVVNVTLGPTVSRVLITGLHTVADIYCSSCQSVLGWKYEQAFEESQKYKEGKYIIEKAKMTKVRHP